MCIYKFRSTNAFFRISGLISDVGIMHCKSNELHAGRWLLGDFPSCPSAIIVLVRLFWCYKHRCLTTLGGDGVFGAGGGVGLGAVAAGVLQRVPAALLLLHTQSSGKNHSQSTGCRGERLTMLGQRANTQNKCTFTHSVHHRPWNK